MCVWACSRFLAPFWNVWPEIPKMVVYFWAAMTRNPDP